MPAIMIRVLVTTWLAALLAVSACKRQQPDQARAARRLDAPGQPTSTASGTSPGTPPGQPPPDGRPALGESEVQALVERWRTAQNDGSFEAYAALYGDRFEGVKRAGEAEQRFDRGGWLDDRKRMFARPMRVDVDELRVQMGERGARVEFVQTWSSGSFGDHGRKRLDIELREDGLARQRAPRHGPLPLGRLGLRGSGVLRQQISQEGISQGDRQGRSGPKKIRARITKS